MDTPQQEQIDRAADLLRDYGPATAYDYMHQAGGLARFPAALVDTVTTQLAGWLHDELSSDAPLAGASSEASGVDVVIIDDDPALQEVVNTVVQDERIRVEVCTDVPEAQRAIRERRPKVVVVDEALSDIDGVQVLTQLRADLRSSRIRVILLTANPAKVRQELPSDAALDAVLLPKSFDIERLLAVVTNALTG